MVKKSLLTAVATSAILLNLATPAFAATTLEISGNGSDSNSTVNLNTTNNTTVVQNNNAKITNNVSANADTGNNDADDNTGGDVEIETGNSNVDVQISNSANSNSASVDCCDQGDTEVRVSGNGTDSKNTVNLNNNRNTEVYQDNNAYVKNNVDVDAKTGGNGADDNTGGNVRIETGNADVDMSISTVANMNSARVGGNGNGGTGSLSAWITGNGSDSYNKLNLDLGGDTTLVQENDAKVKNNVDVYAQTGDNEADDNTGGDVIIETGDADVDVEVDNMVNFNWADVDCGCLLDVLAKIAGNGTDSTNKIAAELGGDLEVYQGGEGAGNDADLDNDVELDAKTGKNGADDNTGGVDSDPSIETGDADTGVSVSNSANMNVFGDADFEMPELDFDFDLSLNLGALLALLGLH